MKESQKLIKDLCEEKNIHFNLVSKDWIMVLEKDNKSNYIIGNKFPLNNYCFAKICDDKYALYEVATLLNIPVAEHYIVFKNYDKEEIIEYGKKYNFNLVVKNNLGTCGNNMFHTASQIELLEKLDLLLSKNYSVSLSPFYDIKSEYRSIVLHKNIELMYGKKKPIVIGDAKSSIYDLLLKFNYNYFSKIENDERLNRVLDLDEMYEYNWQFNLSKGAMPYFINDSDKEEKIKTLVKEIVSKLDIGFASIDIIELTNGELLLLEINSGVMLDNFISIMPEGKEIAKKIYSHAIDEMFQEKNLDGNI